MSSQVNSAGKIPVLYNYDEAAKLLRLSVFTLRRWNSEKKIPHHKIGGRVLFSRENIIEIINRADVKAGA